MKKLVKKIVKMITLFIIGSGTKTFASTQQTVYGPVQVEVLNQVSNKSYSSGVKENILNSNNFGIGTIVASILLFIIGLIVLLDKNISKKEKIAISTVIAIAIVTLIILKICIF